MANTPPVGWFTNGAVSVTAVADGLLFASTTLGSRVRAAASYFCSRGSRLFEKRLAGHRVLVREEDQFSD